MKNEYRASLHQNQVKKAELPVCGKCNSIMDLMQGELNYCPNCGQKNRLE